MQPKCPITPALMSESPFSESKGLPWASRRSASRRACPERVAVQRVEGPAL